jgi:hypothetical protein
MKRTDSDREVRAIPRGHTTSIEGSHPTGWGPDDGVVSQPADADAALVAGRKRSGAFVLEHELTSRSMRKQKYEGASPETPGARWLRGKCGDGVLCTLYCLL